MREEENELNGYNGIGDFNLVDPQKKVSEINLTLLKTLFFQVYRLLIQIF